MADAVMAGTASRGMTREEKKVIFASSLGTVFEWYDFYLYGSLAAFIGAAFFSQYPEATRNIFALLAFAAGFLVRPFGALVFGRLGDLVGRKYTFLVTIVIMGLSTFLVGMLPSFVSFATVTLSGTAHSSAFQSYVDSVLKPNVHAVFVVWDKNGCMNVELTSLRSSSPATDQI